MERGPITLNKEVNHVILEYRGELIPAEKRTKFDSGNGLVVPVMPPTLSTGICRLIHIYYVLRVGFFLSPVLSLSLSAVLSL